MIKANELRIGNLVLDKNNELHEISYNCFQRFRYPSMDGNPSGFSPIPLTEEWLLNFGFEKVVYNSDEEGYGTDYHLKCIDGIYMCYADDFSLGLYHSEYDMLNGLAVIPNWESTKYVHQLQNLYFALTGEELTVKE